LSSIVSKSDCCEITQVLVDGVSKRALEAVVELVYTGSHPVGHHGVSVEEVLEAGAALGLPLTAENVFGDPGKAIFEVAPSLEEQSHHARSREQSLKVSRALKPQGYQAPCIGDAVKQLATDHGGATMAPAGVLGTYVSEEVAGIKWDNTNQLDCKMNEKVVLQIQERNSVSFLPKRHSSSEKIPFQCNLCTFSTSMPSFLRLHVKKVHRQGCPPALICPHCGKGAAGYRGLQIHIAHTHKIKRTSGKGKNGQHAPKQNQQHSPSQQQIGAPVLREQIMKPPQQVGEPPYQNVKRQNVKRSQSVGASTRRSSKQLTRRSSTTKRASHHRSFDPCDFNSAVQVQQPGQLSNRFVQMSPGGPGEKQDTVQNRVEGKVSTKSVFRGYRKRIYQSYSCQLCVFSSTVRGDLVAHMAKVHGPGCPAPLICPECGHGAANKRGLKIHITSVHGKGRDEGSNEPGKEEKQSQSRNQVSSNEMGKSAFVGVERTDFEEYPNQGTPGEELSPLDTERRVKRQRKQLWMRCDPVGGDEFTYSYLKGNYYCDLCPFNCRSRVVLHKHMARVHDPCSPSPFTCPECGYAAATRRGMMMHVSRYHKIESQVHGVGEGEDGEQI